MKSIGIKNSYIMLIFLINFKYTLAQKMNYPAFTKDSSIIDNYFGKTICDPYRLMEKVDNPDVSKWLSEQKKLSDSTLAKLKYRNTIYKQLDKLINASTIKGGMPRVCGDKLFFVRRFTKDNTYKLIYKSNINAEDEILFSTENLNTQSKTFTIDYFEPSIDARYIAFGIAYNSKENARMFIYDMKARKLTDEIIERVNFGTLFWLDNETFFYLQLRELKS